VVGSKHHNEEADVTKEIVTKPGDTVVYEMPSKALVHTWCSLYEEKRYPNRSDSVLRFLFRNSQVNGEVLLNLSAKDAEQAWLDYQVQSMAMVTLSLVERTNVEVTKNGIPHLEFTYPGTLQEMESNKLNVLAVKWNQIAATHLNNEWYWKKRALDAEQLLSNTEQGRMAAHPVMARPSSWEFKQYEQIVKWVLENASEEIDPTRKKTTAENVIAILSKWKPKDSKKTGADGNCA
jgi:hypothetical protein